MKTAPNQKRPETRFAAMLREERVRRGISQETLARECGVHYRSIQGYESGRGSVPNVVTLAKILDALGTPKTRIGALVLATLRGEGV